LYVCLTEDSNENDVIIPQNKYIKIVLKWKNLITAIGVRS